MWHFVHSSDWEHKFKIKAYINHRPTGYANTAKKEIKEY